jgi:hypothetical protein
MTAPPTAPPPTSRGVRDAAPVRVEVITDPRCRGLPRRRQPRPGGRPGRLRGPAERRRRRHRRLARAARGPGRVRPPDRPCRADGQRRWVARTWQTSGSRSDERRDVSPGLRRPPPTGRDASRARHPDTVPVSGPPRVNPSYDMDGQYGKATFLLPDRAAMIKGWGEFTLAERQSQWAIDTK